MVLALAMELEDSTQYHEWECVRLVHPNYHFEPLDGPRLKINQIIDLTSMVSCTSSTRSS